MSKSSTPKTSARSKNMAEVTEAKLKEQAEKLRKDREGKLIVELNAWLKENNCALVTSVPITIDNHPVGISLVAL